MSEISPEIREEALGIYNQHKELIESDAAHGAPLHMRIARTIKAVAGI